MRLRALLRHPSLLPSSFVFVLGFGWVLVFVFLFGLFLGCLLRFTVGFFVGFRFVFLVGCFFPLRSVARPATDSHSFVHAAWLAVCFTIYLIVILKGPLNPRCTPCLCVRCVFRVFCCVACVLCVLCVLFVSFRFPVLPCVVFLVSSVFAGFLFVASFARRFLLGSSFARLGCVVAVLASPVFAFAAAWFAPYSIRATCKFGQTATEKLPPLIEEFVKGEEEIFWLEKRGLCNICLIKPKAIKEGVKRYRNFFVMDKMTAITAEWGGNGISPKKLPLKQKFHTSHAEARGSRFVYNKENKREVIYYSLIDMEKYFTAKHPTEHPQKP